MTITLLTFTLVVMFSFTPFFKYIKIIRKENKNYVIEAEQYGMSQPTLSTFITPALGISTIFFWPLNVTVMEVCIWYKCIYQKNVYTYERINK